MDTAINERAVMGGNNPPAHPLKVRTDGLVASANAWAKVTLADQENADRLSAFLDQLRLAEKDVEATRKSEKQPHLDEAAKVDQIYNPMKSLLATATNLVRPKLTAWLQKLQAEKLVRDEVNRDEVDRLARVAAEAAQTAAAEAAKGGDLVGATVAAEAAQTAAAEAAKDAARAEKAPVNLQSSIGARTKSLRTTWHGRVVSHLMALQHYRNHPDIIALVQTLANRDAGDGVQIPGCEVWKEEKAA